MGLTNRMQAIFVSVSALFIALGTAGATIPNAFPEDFKLQLAAMFWLFGILGFALKEALGGQAPKAS